MAGICTFSSVYGIEWRIPEFSSISREGPSSICSPPFFFAGAFWDMEIVFNDDPFGGVPSRLYLRRTMHSSPRSLVQCTLGWKTACGEKIPRAIFVASPEDSNILRRVVIARYYESFDEINIFCTLNMKFAEDASSDCIPESFKFLPKNTVLENLKQLYLQQKGCDVLIRVKEHEFPAHKAILNAHSPVFESAFQNDMKEKYTNTIDIKDCDPSSFSDFLLFLYCGEKEIISKENVLSLFETADKYLIQNLRVQCVEFMKENLSVDCFCDIFSVALLHSETELNKFATDFFKKNLKKIIVTDKWLSFLTENPIQCNDLLIKALVPNENSNV